MKKILFLLVLSVFAMSNGEMAFAQDFYATKRSMKEIKKSVKSAEKEGWFPESRLSSLLKEFIDHESKISENTIELIGNANNQKSQAMAKSRAHNNVYNEYASSKGGSIKARIVSEMKDIEEQQADNFVAAFERALVVEIKEHIKPSFCIFKQLPNGYYDAVTYHLLDIEKAKKAEQTAMEKAIDEATKNAVDMKKYANELSEFIEEGLN